MKTWVKVLIGIAIALVVLLIVAYFGMGYVIYDKLGNVKGSCDEHLANRPDNFALHPEWPAGFDVTPYFMTGYEAVKFPEPRPRHRSRRLVDPGQSARSRRQDGHPGGWPGRLQELDRRAGPRRNAVAQRVQCAADRSARHRRLHLPGRPLDHRQRGVQGRARRLGLADEGERDRSKADRSLRQLTGRRERNYAFSEEPRIAALFLQSTFGNLQQVIAAELARAGYPTFLAPGALVMGSIVTGVNLFGHDPLSAVRKDTGRPVYIVHTRADTRIHVDQSEQLGAAAQAAGAKVMTWFPENGEHVQTPAVYPQEFEQRLVEFFREAVGE